MPKFCSAVLTSSLRLRHSPHAHKSLALLARQPFGIARRAAGPALIQFRFKFGTVVMAFPSPSLDNNAGIFHLQEKGAKVRRRIGFWIGGKLMGKGDVQMDTHMV